MYSNCRCETDTDKYHKCDVGQHLNDSLPSLGDFNFSTGITVSGLEFLRFQK